MQTLWLYLYFPQLQLDLLQEYMPQSPDPATALTTNITATSPLILLNSQDLKVHQANAAAQTLGIKAGQTLAHACALCATLQVLPWQPSTELQLLQMLAFDCYQLCADLAIAPPNALWLRLDPMLQLYGGLPAFLQQLSQQLHLRPLQFQYGCAVTAEAARLLCLHQPGQVAQTLAEQQRQLKRCPVALLALPATVSQQLQRIGLQQLGDLLTLQPKDLSRRFGLELNSYLQRLQGQLPPLLQYYQPPEQFSAELELLYQLEHHPQLHAPLRHLLLQLQHYLQRRDQLCYQLQLELTLRDKPALCLKLQSPQAEARADRWFALWQLKLEALRLPAPVLAIRLKATQYCGRDSDSADLYAGKQGQYSPLQLIGLLQAKLGGAHVRRPQQHAAFLPEIAGGSMQLQYANSTEQPLQVQQTAPSYHPGASKSTTASSKELSPPCLSTSLPHRPAFLLAVPEPLQQPVRLLPGLERIQSQWWQGPVEARDYLTARSTDGRWLWVYRTPQQQWFVHGVFA